MITNKKFVFFAFIVALLGTSITQEVSAMRWFKHGIQNAQNWFKGTTITSTVFDFSAIAIKQIGLTCGSHSLKNSIALAQFWTTGQVEPFGKALQQTPTDQRQNLAEEDIKKAANNQVICIGNLGDNLERLYEFRSTSDKANLTRLVKNIRNKNPGIYALVLGNMAHYHAYAKNVLQPVNSHNPLLATNGHWVSLVIAINNNGTIYYYYVDSLKSCSNTRNYIINRVNQLFNVVSRANKFGNLIINVPVVYLIPTITGKKQAQIEADKALAQQLDKQELQAIQKAQITQDKKLAEKLQKQEYAACQPAKQHIRHRSTPIRRQKTSQRICRSCNRR